MAKAVKQRVQCEDCWRKQQRKDLIPLKMSFYILLEKVITKILKSSVDPQTVVSLLPKEAVYEALTWNNVSVLAQLLDLFHDSAMDEAFRKYCGDVLSYNIKHGSGIMVGKNYIGVQCVG